MIFLDDSQAPSMIANFFHKHDRLTRAICCIGTPLKVFQRLLRVFASLRINAHLKLFYVKEARKTYLATAAKGMKK